jgi:hypothetical protein
MALRAVFPAQVGVRLLSTAAAVKPSEWDTARPYEEIPGPKPVPIFGNKHLFAVPGFRKSQLPLKYQFLLSICNFHDEFNNFSVSCKQYF